MSDEQPAEPAQLAEAVVVEVPAEDAQSVQNPAEQAPAENPGDKPATEEPPAKQSQSRFERRLNKAYREAAEHKARADFLDRQLQELKPKPASQEGAPKLADFNYDEDQYAKAVTEHAKAEAVKEYTAKQQSESQTREIERLKTSWEEKVTRAESKYDDFDQIVGDIQPTNPLFASIMEAENGDDIAYHLGKNPGEARRIMALSPWQQAREIGKLEAKLLAEVPEPRTVSKVPAPIKPLGAASSPSGKRLTEMSYEEFEKKRRAQIAARR